MNDKFLYIGLNGFAGSGKDTVAKMIKTILNYNWKDLESCKNYYKTIYTNPTISATHGVLTTEKDMPVMCIAFADQLKNICSTIFGIPVERFYQNKSTAWVCINKDFQYTEIKPEDSHIITADEYYCNQNEYKISDIKYFMSLREILVYVGTYVLQQDINRRIFVNVVRNNIREQAVINKNLKYVIVTDIRFEHEIEYIRENNGITITITRDDVKQLDNVAEHDLDFCEDWDYNIENNGTYDELFEKVWNMIHDNIEFKNNIVEFNTRDYVNNYLRLVEIDGVYNTYKLCTPFEVWKVYRTNGDVSLVDPVGGPTITVDTQIPGTDLIPVKIKFDDITNKFLITIDTSHNI